MSWTPSAETVQSIRSAISQPNVTFLCSQCRQPIEPEQGWIPVVGSGEAWVAAQHAACP